MHMMPPLFIVSTREHGLRWIQYTHDAIILTHVMVFILVARPLYQGCGVCCYGNTQMPADQ